MEIAAKLQLKWNLLIHVGSLEMDIFIEEKSLTRITSVIHIFYSLYKKWIQYEQF